MGRTSFVSELESIEKGQRQSPKEDSTSLQTSLTLKTPMSDQDRISPHNINTIPSRQVVRIKKNINKETISRSNTKFSQ